MRYFYLEESRAGVNVEYYAVNKTALKIFIKIMFSSEGEHFES